MADDNPTWVQERIAAELLLKLEIRISPLTIRGYMPDDTELRRPPMKADCDYLSASRPCMIDGLARTS